MGAKVDAALRWVGWPDSFVDGGGLYDCNVVVVIGRLGRWTEEWTPW